MTYDPHQQATRALHDTHRNAHQQHVDIHQRAVRQAREFPGGHGTPRPTGGGGGIVAKVIGVVLVVGVLCFIAWIVVTGLLG